MIMPSYTALPESTLAPSQLGYKFRAQSLAGLRGLGCGCSEYDDSGSCVDPEPCASGLPLCASLTFPAGFVGPINCDPSAGGVNYTPAAGPITTGPTGVMTPTSGLTSAQQAALDQAILKGGFDIAKLLAVQPGTTLTPSTVARQAPGYPIQSLGVGGSLATTGATSGLMLAALAGLALFLFAGNRNN